VKVSFIRDDDDTSLERAVTSKTREFAIRRLLCDDEIALKISWAISTKITPTSSTAPFDWVPATIPAKIIITNQVVTDTNTVHS
jgi:hypothetical protein